MLKAILYPLVMVVGVVNLLGGLIGGIWLLIQGQWTLVFLTAVVAFMGGKFLISLLLLPTLGLGFLSGAAAHRNLYLATGLCSTLANVYTVFIMALWGLVFMHLYLSNAHPNTVVPTLLLSYGPATSPWAYMAATEGEDLSVSTISTFFLQVAYLVTGALIIFSAWSDSAIVTVYLGIMAIGCVVCIMFSWFVLGAMAATDMTRKPSY